MDFKNIITKAQHRAAGISTSKPINIGNDMWIGTMPLSAPALQ